MGFEEMKESVVEKMAEKHDIIKYMTVFRVRHGDTEYKEQLKGVMHDDLTDLGKEQIGKSTEAILTQIDPKRDVVWVISSPRIRTLDSKKIIEERLRAAGVEIWDGTRATELSSNHSAVFERIRNFDFLTDGIEGAMEVVSTRDSRYPEIFNKVVSDLELESPGVPASQQAHLSQHSQLEKSVHRISRTRNQLTYLMRIARTIQPKLNKRIVIIQTEHAESIDDLIEHATRGARTEKKMTGVPKGGVVEVRIPTDSNSNEIEVIFLGGDEHFTIGYDSDKRSFHESQD